MLDEARDRADFETVRLGEGDQVGQARHRSVVVHHFADHGGGREAGHRREVAAGFGMAGAHEDAAVLCLKRKDVAGLDEVARPRVATHSRLDGARPVGGRDAGRHADRRFDRDGEGSAVRGAVLCRHRRQLQTLAALAGKREANEAATEARHEVDRFRRDVVGGDDEIAFVLAIFLVDEDHHAAGGQVGDELGNRGDRHHGNCRREG